LKLTSKAVLPVPSEPMPAGRQAQSLPIAIGTNRNKPINLLFLIGLKKWNSTTDNAGAAIRI